MVDLVAMVPGSPNLKSPADLCALELSGATQHKAADPVMLSNTCLLDQVRDRADQLEFPEKQQSPQSHNWKLPDFAMHCRSKWKVALELPSASPWPPSASKLLNPLLT